MKITHIALAFSLFCIPLSAQANETQTPKPPALLTKKDGKSSPLRVLHLDVKTIVTGNTAETTMTMVFINDTDRILEGELVFPLAEGVTVSRYALDVNGVMRQGVVVEKATARAVYEETIRQNIDPGLVEWTKGNNFRTRIYPIPAKGTKKVSISYEQTLADSAKGLRYQLPFAFTEKLDQFSFKLKIIKPNGKQNIIINNNAGLDLTLQEENAWVLESSKKNFLPGKSLDLEIPRENVQNQTVFQATDGNKYFYIVDTKVNAPNKTIARSVPNKLKIIWDASNSGSQRNHAKEIALLQRYLTQPGIESIDLEILRNDITPAGSYTQETLDQLIQKISTIRYDGATRLELANLKKQKHDAIILVTDGIMTLGQQQPNTTKVPVFILHASQSAEHAMLKSIALKTNGSYTNLINLSTDQAYKMLTTESYKLMSITGDGIKQTFPNRPTAVHGSTSIAGIITADNPTTITLNYGTQNNITAKRTFQIDPNNITKTAGTIPRLWAQKQLSELELQPQRNQEKITNLAKSHQIVTRFTSLLVLDRIEDYVRYRILPPEPEMQKKYQALLKSAPDPNAPDTNFLTLLAKQWQEMVAWHNAKPVDLQPMAEKKIKQMSSAVAPFEKRLNKALEHPKITEKQKSNIQKRLKQIQSFKATKEKITAMKLTKEGLLKQHLKLLADHQGVLQTSRNEGIPSSPSSSIARQIASGTPSSTPVPVPDQTVTEPSLDFGDGNDFGEGWGDNDLDFIGLDAEDASVAEPASDGGAGVDPFSTDEDVIVRPEMTDEASGIPIPANKTATKKKARGNGMTQDKNKAKIKLNKWDPNTPYLKKLRSAQKEKKSTAELEDLYFQQKKEHTKSSAFYLDVAQFFFDLKQEKIALRILSNVAELDMENPALLRILGHRYDQLKKYDLAELIFREVLSLREEEPQSYRDLALVLEKKSTKTGDNNLLQESADLLWEVSTNTWNGRMRNVQLITLTELNALIARNSGKVDTNSYDKRFIHNLDCDLRIVLTWDADNTDIDLWVTDLFNEKCYFSHNRTATQGRMSDDMTQGYGPEVFMIKKALPGTYDIKANYYGNRQQTLAGETTIQATIFTNYGRLNQKRQAITLRLKDAKQIINIGKALYK